MGSNNKWTVFEVEHLYFIGKDTDGKSINKWKKQIVFYFGYLTNVEILSDWRFCEVKEKRKQAICKGIKTNPEFPIVYPLILDDGSILDGYECIKYDDEKEF